MDEYIERAIRDATAHVRTDGRPASERARSAIEAAYPHIIEGVAGALAEDGDFDRWMREQHLDRRNGTTNTQDAIRVFLLKGEVDE